MSRRGTLGNRGAWDDFVEVGNWATAIIKEKIMKNKTSQNEEKRQDQKMTGRGRGKGRESERGLYKEEGRHACQKLDDANINKEKAHKKFRGSRVHGRKQRRKAGGEAKSRYKRKVISNILARSQCNSPMNWSKKTL